MYEYGDEFYEAWRPMGVTTDLSYYDGKIAGSDYIVCECSEDGDRQPINIIAKIWK